MENEHLLKRKARCFLYKSSVKIFQSKIYNESFLGKSSVQNKQTGVGVKSATLWAIDHNAEHRVQNT